MRPRGAPTAARWPWAVMGLILCGVLWAVCSQPNTTAVKLEEAIRTAGTSGQVLRIEDTTDFAWDELYVFGPYAGDNGIPEELGIVTPGLIHISSQDENLFVFVRERKVVTSFYLPTEKAGFLFKSHERYSRERAVFRMQPAGGGAFTLHPAR